MRIVDKRIKSVKPSQISRFLFPLLGAEYDSKIEQLFSVVLVLASLLLGMVPLYTTVKDLYEYTPTAFAILVDIGIQSLLFITIVMLNSWNTKPIVLLIHFITHLTNNDGHSYYFKKH